MGEAVKDSRRHLLGWIEDGQFVMHHRGREVRVSGGDCHTDITCGECQEVVTVRKEELIGQ